MNPVVASGHILSDKIGTSWQTKRGAIMMVLLPGVTPAKPGSIAKLLPGLEIHIVDFSTEVRAFHRYPAERDTSTLEYFSLLKLIQEEPIQKQQNGESSHYYAE
jgi:hypothetical protein